MRGVRHLLRMGGGQRAADALMLVELVGPVGGRVDGVVGRLLGVERLVPPPRRNWTERPVRTWNDPA